MNRHLKAIFLSFLDMFTEDLGYHSASLTYQFLTVIGSVIMLIGFASMYLPFLEPEKLFPLLKELIPSHADAFVDRVLPVYEKRGAGSILSLIAAYYFAFSFARSLNNAFSFVYGRKPMEVSFLFWALMPLLLILYSTALSLTMTLLTLTKSFLGSFYQRLTELLNLLTLFLILLMLYTPYFRLRMATLFASALVSLMLLSLNKIFSLIMVKMLSTSPLYSVIGSPLIFLVWLYYSFFCLLYGVRFMSRLDQSLQ